MSNDARLTSSVQRVARPVRIDGIWDKAPWTGIQPLAICNHMGEKPAHFPVVHAKIAYDDAAIYVIFRVEDRYVRAVAQQTNDPVCLDSCVEFFFTPGLDLTKGYFNLEMNCGGTILFRHQIQPRERCVDISEDDCRSITIAHSMPKIVDPEIPGPLTWTAEYRLPTAMLCKYAECAKPAVGVSWRANVYKCADKTSHPHWLTWSPVDRPKPAFHVPESFGTLEFE